MLAEVEAPVSRARGPTPAANVPGATGPLEDSPLMTGAPFELAAEYLGDEEITERIAEVAQGGQGQLLQHRGGRSPLHHARDRRGHPPLQRRAARPQRPGPVSTLKSLRVSLIQRFLTEQLDFINVAKEVVRITDFHDLLDRMIMTEGCHGKLGARPPACCWPTGSCEQPDAAERGLGEVKMPRTWYDPLGRHHGLHQAQRPRRRHGPEVQGHHPGPARVSQHDPAVQEQHLPARGQRRPGRGPWTTSARCP